MITNVSNNEDPDNKYFNRQQLRALIFIFVFDPKKKKTLEQRINFNVILDFSHNSSPYNLYKESETLKRISHHSNTLLSSFMALFDLHSIVALIRSAVRRIMEKKRIPEIRLRVIFHFNSWRI